MTLFVENTREPDEYRGFQGLAIGGDFHLRAGRRSALPLHFCALFRNVSRGGQFAFPGIQEEQTFPEVA